MPVEPAVKETPGVLVTVPGGVTALRVAAVPVPGVTRVTLAGVRPADRVVDTASITVTVTQYVTCVS